MGLSAENIDLVPLFIDESSVLASQMSGHLEDKTWYTNFGLLTDERQHAVYD